MAPDEAVMDQIILYYHLGRGAAQELDAYALACHVSWVLQYACTHMEQAWVLGKARR